MRTPVYNRDDVMAEAIAHWERVDAHWERVERIAAPILAHANAANIVAGFDADENNDAFTAVTLAQTLIRIIEHQRREEQRRDAG